MNQTYADGTPNPNVGRPYVAQAASGGEDNNYQTTTTRQVWRFTPTAELRASDFFGNSTLAKILGKSDFTGLYEKNTVDQSTFQFAEYSTTPSFITDNNQPSNGITNADRIRAAALNGPPTSGLPSSMPRRPRART